MTDPSVSIVIPVFDRQAFIGAAIDSALGQDLPEVEVIVVDDGSTDTTPAIIAGYRDRVTFIRTQNRGVSAARNTGLSQANGKYVYFLDSDDTLQPEAISRLVAFAEQFEPSRIVVGLAETFDEKGSRSNDQMYLIPGYRPGRDIDPEAIIARVLSCILCLYPAEILRDSGGFQEEISFGEDYELNSRLALERRLFFATDCPVVRVRLHEDFRLSKNVQSSRYEMLLEVFKRRISESEEIFARPTSQNYRLKFAKWLWSLGRNAYRDGHWAVGDQYIQTARQLGGANAECGSVAARLAYRVMAPGQYERASMALKSLFG